jgi:ElaB/YqjD/DUF883 family membrane-anchored ribosome-binding protein
MTDDATRIDRSPLTGEPIDQDTAEKLEELEQTRTEMHDTVEEIGDRLAPASIAQNAKETVRDATVGKVEDMAETAGRMFDEAGMTAQQAGYGVWETVRRNPIPAAMAGIGLAWLVTHRSTASGRPMQWRGGYDPRLGRSDWRTERGRGTGVKERISDVGDQLGERAERVGERADAVGQRIGQQVDAVTERVGDVPDEMSYRVRDLGDQARSVFEESPLAVGAVAVAVGTAIGAVLPVTGTERRMLRPATEKAIETAERTATKALSEVERGTKQASSTTSSKGTPRGSTKPKGGRPASADPTKSATQG